MRLSGRKDVSRRLRWFLDGAIGYGDIGNYSQPSNDLVMVMPMSTVRKTAMCRRVVIMLVLSMNNACFFPALDATGLQRPTSCLLMVELLGRWYRDRPPRPACERLNPPPWVFTKLPSSSPPPC